MVLEKMPFIRRAKLKKKKHFTAFFIICNLNFTPNNTICTDVLGAEGEEGFRAYLYS